MANGGGLATQWGAVTVECPSAWAWCGRQSSLQAGNSSQGPRGSSRGDPHAQAHTLTTMFAALLPPRFFFMSQPCWRGALPFTQGEYACTCVCPSLAVLQALASGSATTTTGHHPSTNLYGHSAPLRLLRGLFLRRTGPTILACMPAAAALDGLDRQRHLKDPQGPQP